MVDIGGVPPQDPLPEVTFVPAVTFLGFASIAESHLTQRYTLKRQPVFYDGLSIKAQQLHPNMSYYSDENVLQSAP